MKRMLTLLASAVLIVPAHAGNVRGRVISEGKPLGGVQVSDGCVIVTTDSNGRYDFQSDKTSGMVFITTPSGYVASSADGIRPGFWQHLNLDATQDEIHDFQLVPQNQTTYTVMFLTDCHLVNDPRREDLRRFRDIVFPHVCSRVEDASANGPVYSFNLGDFTHDIYWYEFDFNESDGLRFLQDMGWPAMMYSVTGNHDHDGAVVGDDVDRRAGWRYRDVWGPDRYSVNIGGDHWVFLDDIVYKNIEGKGKKAPGIKGDRSYSYALTESQLQWLEKDLASLDRDTPVYICCHAPFFATTRKPGPLLPAEQVERLDRMAAAFKDGITVFSGHIHLWDICDSEDYVHMHQIGLPATSGIMWETPNDWKLTSSDGSDSGIFEGTFAAGKAPEYHFGAYIGGEIMYRVYDMNEVGKAYRESEPARKQLEMFGGSRLFYGDRKYRNYVFVNYWGWRPGDTVELLENGKPLVCERRKSEDPVHNFAYDLPIISEERLHHTPNGEDSCSHMCEFKTHGARTPLLLRIRDKEGNVRYEEEIVRPLAFDPSGHGNY